MEFNKTLYRYNCQDRKHRKYNQTGKEKNPNNIKFYATSLEYAEGYKYILDNDGDIVYECDLEVAEISANLFDMNACFENLSTYKYFIGQSIGQQLKDYTGYLNDAKNAKAKKFWNEQISELQNREYEIIQGLFARQFQDISDYDYQNLLVAELKSLGFEGYFTTKEVAIF